MTRLLPCRPERAVYRLRKWIILRLVSIVNSLHLEKEEALIEEVARCETCSDHTPHGGSSRRVGLLPSPSLGRSWGQKCWGQVVHGEQASRSCPLGRMDLGEIPWEPVKGRDPGSARLQGPRRLRVSHGQPLHMDRVREVSPLASPCQVLIWLSLQSQGGSPCLQKQWCDLVEVTQP